MTIKEFMASRAHSFKAYDESEEMHCSDYFAGDRIDFCTYFLNLM
eukprot:gene21867-27940_t